MSEPKRAPLRPDEERVRRMGQVVVQRFLALIRVGRSYQVGNKVFRQQAESFLESLAPVFESAAEAVLVTLDTDLYLNGVRLPVKSTNLRFQRALVAELTRRRIAGVRIAASVTVDQVERFFTLFLQPHVHFGPGLLEACLAEGVDGMLPAVHASTESWGEEEGAAPAEGASEDAAGPGGAGPGRGGPGLENAAFAPARAASRKSFALAVQGARSLLTTTSLQGGVETRHAKRVVQPLVDGAFANEPVVVGLSSLGHHDEYTYAHSVNVCLVAVTIGRVLGFERRALADLGVAALLHDVGKAAVYDGIRHPLEEFDADERALAERHPLEGARLIARTTTLNPTTLRCMRTALEHHAAGPGATPEAWCYPALPADWSPSRLSEVIAVADAYVSLQMHRSPRGAHVTPHQALGMMLGPLAPRFEPALLWALVRSMGFYPPGQIVELDDGALALVLAPNPDDPARPHVRVIMDHCGVPFSPLEAKEFKPLPPDRIVRRALGSEEYPVISDASAA